jgi:hypothetical protein
MPDLSSDNPYVNNQAEILVKEQTGHTPKPSIMRGKPTLKIQLQLTRREGFLCL